MPYFLQGQFLFIKGKSTTKKWSKDEDDLEFKILTIELLSELRDKSVKGITLNITTENVTQELIDTISDIVDLHEGKCDFSVQIKDNEEGVIKLLSRTKRVDLNDEFLDQLNKIEEISYKLN